MPTYPSPGTGSSEILFAERNLRSPRRVIQVMSVGILQDVRFGLRAMARSKMLTLVAVAALAVGIGLNTTVFSLVNAVLLKGLPFEDPHEIVHLRAANASTGQQMTVSRPEFKDWREQAASFESLAAFMGSPINLSDDERFPESVDGTLVSPNIFRGVRQPVLMGRDFTEEDSEAGAEPVAIIGEGLWQRRYGGDPNVLGQTIRANGLAFTIVGIMPLGMEFPNNSNIWFVVRDGDPDFDSRANRYFQVVGRLREGVSLAQADAEMAAITRGLAEQYPDTNENVGARILTTAEFYNGGEIRVVFLSLLGAVTFVLFIACANVANLRLAQALRRMTETSIRTALGASRWRIVRQLLTESLLLSVLGGALGLGFAFVGVRLFDRAVANIGGKPYWIDFSIDYMVFGYLGIVCVGTAILFGLMPALKASRADLNASLKDGSRSSLGGLKSRRWTGALIVAELSLTLVLLVGAGLMFRSLLNMQQVDFGVETDGVIVAQLLLPRDGYSDAEERIAFHDRLLDELRGIPGLTASALVSNAPGIGGTSNQPFGIPGRDLTDARGEPLRVDTVAVSHGFFETFSTRVRGRPFVETDGTDGARVAIVNPAFAETYWPGEDPIGRYLELGTGEEMETLTVVGVSEAIRHRVGPGESNASVPPTVYFPFRQQPPAFFSSILVRGNADRETLVTGMRTALRSVDPDLPAADPRSYDEWLAEATWPYRVFGSLFAIAAVVALVLSSAGIFSVTSFSIDQRTQEIGLRVAMGATNRDILWLVARRGVLQLIFGLVLGTLGAIAMTRVLAGVMFGIGTSDPATLASVALILSVVTASACFFPARRATRLDPMSAIRFE